MASAIWDDDGQTLVVVLDFPFGESMAPLSEIERLAIDGPLETPAVSEDRMTLRFAVKPTSELNDAPLYRHAGMTSSYEAVRLTVLHALWHRGYVEERPMPRVIEARPAEERPKREY